MFLITQTTNATFVSSDRGKEYASLEEARAAAVESSLRIASDEIQSGKSSSSVEAALKDIDGRQVDRLVVSASVAPLILPKLSG